MSEQPEARRPIGFIAAHERALDTVRYHIIQVDAEPPVVVHPDLSIEYRHLHYTNHEPLSTGISIGSTLDCGQAPGFSRKEAEAIISALNLEWLPTSWVQAWGISQLGDDGCYGNVIVITQPPR